MKEVVLVSASNAKKAEPYVAALEAVGIGRERVRVLLPAAGAPAAAEARALAARAAGLVLSGGADIHPRHYGEEIQPQAEVEVNERRDELELALLEGAREARVPVWAVCRGMQVANVFLGGTLWQDLPTQLPSHLDHHPDGAPDKLAHDVQVTEPESALGGVLGHEPLPVNSRHHQAVKDLAPGLVPVAVAPDGLIEAFELPADGAGWWLRAVQWHPENLVALDRQRELWRAFAEAARPAR